MINLINTIQINIKTLDDLRDIIKEIKMLLRRGVIRESPILSNFEYSIENISISDGLPDYFQSHFYSKKHNKYFRLSVETFHGVGGSFAILENPNQLYNMDYLIESLREIRVILCTNKDNQIIRFVRYLEEFLSKRNKKEILHELRNALQQSKALNIYSKKAIYFIDIATSIASRMEDIAELKKPKRNEMRAR